MYKNLEAELVRSSTSKNDLAKKLGISRKALYLKLNGKTDFTISEMKSIKEIFHNLTLEYLFDETV